MKWYANASFPHPVLSQSMPLRAERDYQNQDFTLETKMSFHEKRARFEFAIDVSEEALKSLIHENKAFFAVEITCASTYFRCLYPTTSTTLAFSLRQKGALLGYVEAVAFIICNKSVGSERVLRSKNLHPELAGLGNFKLERSDVLGISKRFRAWVGREAKNGSIFNVAPSKKVAAGTFDMQYDEHRLQILLSGDGHREFERMRTNQENHAYFLSSIYMPALAAALSKVVSDDAKEYSEKRWFQVLTDKLDAGKYSRDNLLLNAQKLLTSKKGVSPISGMLQQIQKARTHSA